jgi:hypothetical protein
MEFIKLMVLRIVKVLDRSKMVLHSFDHLYRMQWIWSNRTEGGCV